MAPRVCSCVHGCGSRVIAHAFALMRSCLTAEAQSKNCHKSKRGHFPDVREVYRDDVFTSVGRELRKEFALTKVIYFFENVPNEGYFRCISS